MVATSGPNLHTTVNPPPEIGSGAGGAAAVDRRADGNEVSDVYRPGDSACRNQTRRNLAISDTAQTCCTFKRFLGSYGNLAGRTVFSGRERRRWRAADIKYMSRKTRCSSLMRRWYFNRWTEHDIELGVGIRLS